MNILAEVSDLSCAALQWGIDKDFNQKAQKWTIIYDLGATSAGAALVRYSTFEGKDAGKKKQHGQFEIKAVKWDESVGGEDMDMLLVDHFLAEFDAKHKPSVSAFDSPKAIAKLRKQVRKTKEILSANKEAPLSVEGMHEDVDFRSTITRKDFEALAKEKGIFTRAAGPLKAIVDSLADFDITLKDIEVVEAIGGATRVPGVKKALSEALDGRALDFHLDADEAVAMGAGLFAANMSTTFRMRKFGAADAAPYALEVDLGKGPEHDRKTLLPLYKRFPVRRVVSVANATEDAKFTVHHADPERLPPGIVDAKVAEFAITGVPDAMKKHDKVGDIKAHFAVDSSGILYLEKAEYVVEVVDMVEVKPPPPPAPKKAKTDSKGDKKEAPKKNRSWFSGGKKKADPEPDPKADDAEGDDAKGRRLLEDDAEGDDAKGRRLLEDDAEGDDAKGRRLLEDDAEGDDAKGRRLLEDDAEGDDEEVPDAPLPEDTDAPAPPPTPTPRRRRRRTPRRRNPTRPPPRPPRRRSPSFASAGASSASP